MQEDMMTIGLLSLFILLGCGCQTIDFQKGQTTPLGITILSPDISKKEIARLDSQYQWALDRGLVMVPSLIKIEVVEGDKFLSQSSPTGYAASEVEVMYPCRIKLTREHLDYLSHEFYHIILFQKTGDSDHNHLNPSWKELGLF